MKIGIVILSHNGTDITLRCLDSLSPTMSRNDDYFIVLIDNGSVDNILGDKIEEKNYPWHDRLYFIRLDSNLGVAGGRNIGIKECILYNAEYILLLDNDILIKGHPIEDLYKFLEKHNDFGLVAPCLTNKEGEIQLSFKKFPGITEKFLNLLGRKDTLPHKNMSEILFPFYVIGACQMFRAALVEKIGILDDRIFFGPEDADFCIRIRNAGYKVAYIPNIKIIHDWQRNSRRSLFSRTARKHIKGLFYFYRKWHRCF